MADAVELAIPFRAQRNRLDACRLVAYHRIHLRAGELHTHGFAQHLCGKSRNQGMWPHIAFAAEAAAEKLRDHVDLRWRDAKHDRH